MGEMIRTMVILNENMESSQMFQFTSDENFTKGDIIEHERLNGKHIVRFVDPATVQVQFFSDMGLNQCKDGSWEIKEYLL